MMKNILLVCALALLSACSSSTTIIVVTATSPAPTTVPSLAPTATQEPVLPTDTAPAPTATTAPTLAASSGNQFAWNYIGDQTSGGVRVQIARVSIGEKDVMGQDFSAVTQFNNTPVVVELVFIVTNTTDKVISIYPDQGTAVAGDEQVDLTDFMMGGEFGDSFSGDIQPGVKRIGGMWFGLKRIALPDLQKLTILFSGPVGESFNSLGSDYKFVLDLSNRQFEPLPTELK